MIILIAHIFDKNHFEKDKEEKNKILKRQAKINNEKIIDILLQTIIYIRI